MHLNLKIFALNHYEGSWWFGAGPCQNRDRVITINVHNVLSGTGSQPYSTSQLKGQSSVTQTFYRPCWYSIVNSDMHCPLSRTADYIHLISKLFKLWIITSTWRILMEYLRVLVGQSAEISKPKPFIDSPKLCKHCLCVPNRISLPAKDTLEWEQS